MRGGEGRRWVLNELEPKMGGAKDEWNEMVVHTYNTISNGWEKGGGGEGGTHTIHGHNNRYRTVAPSPPTAREVDNECSMVFLSLARSHTYTI